MSIAIIDKHTIGAAPPIAFEANEGHFLHVGPNNWVLNLGVFHAGTMAPPLILDIVGLVPGDNHPYPVLHDWSASHVGPAWTTNLQELGGAPVPVTVTPSTATRGYHTLTLSSGEIYNVPQGAGGVQWSLPSQHLTIVDRVV